MVTNDPPEYASAEMPTSADKVSGSAPPLLSFSSSEFRFVAAFAIILCVLTSLPYWAARRAVIPGKVFTGLLVQSFDSNNYLAYSRQAADGQWLFRNPMTPEPHEPVFFNLEWLLIGKVASVLHVSLTDATDILRIVSIAGMCFGVYWLSIYVLQNAFMRRLALVAIMAGGGFGWIVAVHLIGVRLNSSFFLDLTNANLFPFYWELKLAHFLISETFIVLGLAFFLCAERNKQAVHYVGAGLCYMAAGTCRPYDMLFAMASTVLYLGWSFWSQPDRRSSLVLRATPVIMCVPLLGYFLWLFKIHPVFRWWTIAGNPAPPAWLLAWSFGPSFFLLLVAAWRLRRGGLTDSGIFMLSCFVTAVVLAHLHGIFHFAFQFATNILLPMVMLVLLGLESAIMAWSDRSTKVATISVTGLLFLNSLTSLALTGQAVVLARRGEFHTDAAKMAVYSWLDQHSQKNDVVLADLDIANEIPQYTRDVVFCGYGNAVDFARKTRQLKQFLDPATGNAFRQDLIRQYGIRFVLLTTTEEHAAPTLAEATFVKEIFRNSAAVIYAVTDLPRKELAILLRP